MTYPPDDASGQQGGGYPGYPSSGYGAPQYGAPQYGAPPYAAPQPTRLRGRRTIQVGGILMGVGLVLAIVGGVVSQKNAYGKVNDFQRVAVKDGTGTITFEDSGGYVAYYESDSVTNSTDQRIPLVPTRLTNEATGQAMILHTPYGNRSDNKIKYLHYDHDGHKGLAMYQFHIDEAGTYQVELRDISVAAEDATVAFGTSIASGVVIAGVFVIVGVLVLLGGLITLIVGLVLRRRHKRILRTGRYGGPQPAGWPPAGGPAQQGGQPPGWPPPDA